MEVEKRGKGGFLQLFDWNGKSRKKLFSSKPDLPGTLLLIVTVVMFATFFVALVLLYSVLFWCLNVVCGIECREFEPWKRELSWFSHCTASAGNSLEFSSMGVGTR